MYSVKIPIFEDTMNCINYVSCSIHLCVSVEMLLFNDVCILYHM